MTKVRHYREINGATLDPFSAYMIIRGMKTLVLRMRQQQSSARALAEFLCTEPLVESVNYPGLPSHPKPRGGLRTDVRFRRHCQLCPDRRHGHGQVAFCRACASPIAPAISVRWKPSTARHAPPATSKNTLEERLALGISEGLVRVSVGIEDTDDLVDDLKQAFAFVKKLRDELPQTTSTNQACTETAS
ncbi:PLP-dependent transferase [Pseudomonas sp. B21-054]|uniref:PLP-dependent transferase n=1 Tax=Pseudomonas sp. B21-054 TaxID=2895494 RepID=UPI0039B6F863